MSKLGYGSMTIVLFVLVAACGREPLLAPGELDGQGGAGGGAGGKGGKGGAGGNGAGGTVILQLPDGGISALLGDSGILGGILDAPRDSLLGQVFCPPEAKLGAKCDGSTQACLLPSLGGACACMSGTYLCPLDPTSEPQPCPKNVTTGTACISPLTICIGGSANACICLVGSYSCL